MKSKVSGLLDEALASEIQNLIYGPRLEGDFRNVFVPMTEANQAHVVMLAKTGIVAPETAATLAGVLLDLEAAGPSAFPLDPAREESYFNYEAKVIDMTGPEVGGCMHVARSRNDLKVAIDRLRSRAACLDILDALARVRRTALERAETHAHVVMPGYTHLQPAQPTTFGYYLLGFASAFERDHQRIADAYKRINLNPLGACAFAGTSFPVDRHLTRELLGFDGLVEHNQDAVASRDFAVELLAACTLLGLTWSRLAQDLYVMITHEFQTVRFPDRVFGTSSIMPQKKNPTVIEHLRGRAAQLMGSLTTTMAAIKGTNFTISMDGFFDALRGYFDSLADTVDGLTLMEMIVRTAEPDAARMLELARGNFSTVTDLTDALVRETGLSFREAHHVVGAVVRLAVDRGLTADRITADLVGEAGREVLGRTLSVSAEIVARSLDPAGAVAARNGIGGPAPDEVTRMIAGARQRLDADARWIGERREGIEAARKKLRDETTALAGRPPSA
jgi:argininosuccinate lyase